MKSNFKFLLVISFTTVAVFSVAIVLVFLLLSIQENSRRSARQRADGLTQGVQQLVQSRLSQLQNSGQVLAQDRTLFRLLTQANRGVAQNRLIQFAAQQMKRLSLDFLIVTDVSGKVLARGHLPEAFDDVYPFPEGFSLQQLVPENQAAFVYREAMVAGGTNFGSVVLGFRLDDLQRQVLQIAGVSGSIQSLTGRSLLGATENVGVGRNLLRDVPIIWHSKPLALFHLEIPLDLEQQFLTQMRRVSVLGGGVALLVALTLALVLARRISRPVTALTAGALNVSNGDFRSRIEQRERGDFGVLIGAFNTMVEKIQEQRSRLERVSRIAAWRDIARRLAHEIKNPLMPIQLGLQTITRHFGTGENQELLERTVKPILAETKKLQRLVENFSEFGRMPDPSFERTDLAALLETVYRVMKPAAPENVALEMQLGALPTLSLDPVQINQVVTNLIKNAFESGQNNGEIVLSAVAKDDGSVVIQVMDQGKGIPAGHREKILTPQFTTKKTGSGLGLVIVEKIVLDHNGKLEIDSEPERGTTVRVFLYGIRY